MHWSCLGEGPEQQGQQWHHQRRHLRREEGGSSRLLFLRETAVLRQQQPLIVAVDWRVGVARGRAVAWAEDQQQLDWVTLVEGHGDFEESRG